MLEILHIAEEKYIPCVSSFSPDQKATKYLFGLTYRDVYEGKEVDIAIKDGANINAVDRNARSI